MLQITSSLLPKTQLPFCSLLQRPMSCNMARALHLRGSGLLLMMTSRERYSFKMGHWLSQLLRVRLVTPCYLTTTSRENILNLSLALQLLSLFRRQALHVDLHHDLLHYIIDPDLPHVLPKLRYFGASDCAEVTAHPQHGPVIVFFGASSIVHRTCCGVIASSK